MAEAARSAPQALPRPEPDETLEELLHEQFGFVRLYAGIAQGYCEASDFVGLNYSMRQLIARVRLIAGALNDRNGAGAPIGDDTGTTPQP